jgi:MauM/NapG family ferredoxin protein
LEAPELKSRRPGRFDLLQWLRIFTQIAFFGLFLYLLLGARFSAENDVGAVERFFHFDPLLGLTTFLASRAFFTAFLLALVTVAVTVLLGRHACGWLCPLGALLQCFSFAFKKAKWHRPRLEGSRSLAWKYVILLFVLVGSVLTVNLAGLLDPLSLLHRSFTIAVLPALAVAAGATAALLRKVGASSLGDGLAQSIQNLTLNATFDQGLAIGLMFLGVVMLNLVRERFWCRYVCPAGAMLGVLGRWNLVKLKVDAHKCDNCNLCALHCETQATPGPNGDWRPSECVYCYTCAAVCPKAAIDFPLKLAPARAKPIDLLRRRLVLAPAIGLAAVPLFRISASKKRASEKLIRPPGALPEAQFLATCVQCGECMKACPTNGLQPALTEAGAEGLWTPVLVPRIGSCEYYCAICTQVCPTGAIQELTITEKIQTRIGSAWVRTHRCVPYVRGETCTVCEESCPTSPKAIVLLRIEVLMPDGSVAAPRAPLVDPELCIGCGICETKCPVVDEPAIYCTSFGESRADKSRQFLSPPRES